MATHVRAGLIFVLLFAAGPTGGAKLGNRAADALILHHVYGGEAVVRQHLRIVSDKPHLRVSNGDVLQGYDLVHFVITSVMFVTVGLLAIVVAVLLMIPLSSRQEPKQPIRRDGDGRGWFPLVLFLPLAATMMLIHSLWPNAIAVVVAVCLAWSPPRWFASRIERV